MDEEIKRGSTDLMIHIGATKLLVTEELAIALIDSSKPAKTLQLMKIK
jgi:hypothetical protein